MAWRVAKSLLTLRDQVNAAFPNRDKSSDGTIGDERHQATHSEHNPDANGVVRAMDITNDPAHGLSSRKLAEALVASRDPRILYLISNAQIISSQVSPWQWRPYNGVNAHRQHMHLSVVEDPRLYDSTVPWNFGDLTKPPVMAPADPPVPMPPPVTVSPEARLAAAKIIIDFEARRDRDGHLMVYHPPASDGGGAFEVAGLNERYNPVEANHLAELLGEHKYAEAEAYALEAIAKDTDPAAKWSSDPGVQFLLRDTFFNRGSRGAAITVQHAVGATEDGIVGPKTLKAIADMPPNDLIDAMRHAREWYERTHVGYRAVFWQGLLNRWNKATASAKQLDAVA